MEIANADDAESDQWQSFSAHRPEERPIGIWAADRASWSAAEFLGVAAYA